MPLSARRLLIALLLAAIAATAPAEVPQTAVPEKYDFRAGQSATYEVEIRVDDGQSIHVMSGLTSYTVTAVQDGAADFRFSGRLSERFEDREGRPVLVETASPYGNFPVFRGTPGEGLKFQLDDRGRPVPSRSPQAWPLPYLLGNLAELALVPLPEIPQDGWASEVGGFVRLQRWRSGPPSLSDFVPSFPYGANGGMSGPPPAAVETVEYAVRDGVAIRRHALRTREPVSAGRPRIELTSRGTVAFAEDGFLPAEIAWEGRLEMRQGFDSSVRLIALSATRLTPEVAAELLARQERERREADERRWATPKRIPADLDGLLADLHSGDDFTVRSAVHVFQSSGTSMNDARVAEALAKLWHETDRDRSGPLAQAIVKWATPDQGALVVSVLDSKDDVARHRAIGWLSRQQFPEATPRLAEALRDPIDRGHAAAALKRFGPLAEDAVGRQLSAVSLFTRAAAVELLREIGTSRSVPALRKAAADEPSLGPRVDAAIRAIEARPEKQGPVT